MAYRIWSELTVVEGLTNDTAGGRWKAEADELLACLKAEDCKLTYEDGTLATSSGGGSGPRFYPGVTQDLDDEENEPYFTRSQAHEW